MDRGKQQIEITYRPMTVDDLDEVVQLEEAVFTSPWTKDLFLHELEENKYSLYVVAVVGEKIVGYAGIWCVFEQGQITNIGVLESYRGHKIGETLLDILLQSAKLRECHDLSLEVRVSNTIAQNLYKKYGFQYGNIRKNYYKDNNEDAHVMWVRL
ncbi:MAG: ribosomal protein S18-alanine N-acetyltransferase [Bacilli bacterium]